MVEEIKVGEYVRTDYGVSKVVPKINAWITNEQVTLDLYNGIRNISIFKNIVKKHSKDIIDLIEVGDYVNGKEVVYDANDSEVYNGHKTIGVSISNDNSVTWTIVDTEIKSIVTKEQFNQMKYIVGDESNVKD